MLGITDGARWDWAASTADATLWERDSTIKGSTLLRGVREGRLPSDRSRRQGLCGHMKGGGTSQGMAWAEVVVSCKGTPGGIRASRKRAHAPLRGGGGPPRSLGRRASQVVAWAGAAPVSWAAWDRRVHRMELRKLPCGWPCNTGRMDM